MKIGFREFVISPEFPVQGMTLKEKIMECSDDLHCRVLVIEPDEGRPWYHISIDVVEVWKAYRDRIKETVEGVLGHEIDLVVSATHAHVTPFITTDEQWREFLLKRIADNIADIPLSEYEELSYLPLYYF